MKPQYINLDANFGLSFPGDDLKSSEQTRIKGTFNMKIPEQLGIFTST